MICSTQYGSWLMLKGAYYIFLQDGETWVKRGIERKDYKEGIRDGAILVEQGGWVSMSLSFSTFIH